ncbi:MAG: thioesterase family protein [Parvularculaceae bacterium]|nr:thioesterase family protein [Parvularculaceae bacterium]
MIDLEKSLSLAPTGENSWRAFADPACEANTGMFGGWTAALMMKAAIEAGDAGTPVAITISFASRIEPGSVIGVRATTLASGRSISHRRVEISGADGDIRASASIVIARRRENDRFIEFVAPEAPAPETFQVFHPPGPFGATVDVRPVAGFPPLGQENTKSLSWVRDLSGAPLDLARLAYRADVAPPRIWYIGDQPRPSSTITMSVYFYASDEELAAVGADYVLTEVTGVRAEGSVFGHSMRLWSRSGALLATSEQLCWFR